jgi:glutamyl/glutaminyl-tRNA synthetase
MVYRRTRLAPTPSGFLHLGNVLSFSVTAFLARRAGADILLRIDDMDRERVQPAYIKDIFDTLSFLSIPFDEGPGNPAVFESSFSQRCRLDLYENALIQLQAMNAVFACTCSRSQLAIENNGVYQGTCRHKNLPLDTPGAAWRVLTDDRPITIKDIYGTQLQEQLPPDMRYFIVRKKDGYPAYQLTSLLDDLYWNTDLIVRGADLFPSTIAQLFLAGIMNKQSFLNAHFYHHLLLTSPDAQKYSKSAGATSIHFLKNEGITASQIFSMIGEMLGKTGVKDWKMLGEVVVG